MPLKSQGFRDGLHPRLVSYHLMKSSFFFPLTPRWSRGPVSCYTASPERSRLPAAGHRSSFVQQLTEAEHNSPEAQIILKNGLFFIYFLPCLLKFILFIWSKLDLSSVWGRRRGGGGGEQTAPPTGFRTPMRRKEINIPWIFEGWIWGPAGPVGSNPSLISSSQTQKWSASGLIWTDFHVDTVWGDSWKEQHISV